jgi:hypothetical protein
MAREIYAQYGVVRGFYAGFIPSAFRNMLKSLYRWPLMLFLPRAFETLYPKPWTDKFAFLSKGSTGVSLAAVDAFLVCPLERLKVVLQTKQSDITIRQFMREHKADLSKSMFAGLTPFFYRNLVSWTSFLYFDYLFKKMFRSKLNISNQVGLDSFSLLQISLLVGVANITSVMPLDILKTLKQQHSKEFAKATLLDMAKRVYRESGFKGFYYGWQPRMAQYLIQSVFTVPILDKLEVRQRKIA